MSSWGRKSLLHRELHRPRPGKGGGEFWIRGCPTLGGCDQNNDPRLLLTQDVHALIPGAGEHVTLQGKRDSADVLRPFQWRSLDYADGPN